MASLQLNHKSIQKAQERLENMRQTDEKWSSFISQYQISSAELVTNLIRIFQIQAYLVSVTQLDKTDRNGSLALLNVDPLVDWFNLLIQGSTLRYYDKAREYKAIKPFGE